MKLLRRIVLWLAAATVTLILLLSLARLYWSFQAQARLEAVQLDIRNAGLPTTTAEILPANIPEQDNAAPLLEQAVALLKALKERDDFIDAVPGSSSPERSPDLFDAERLAALRAQMALPEAQQALSLLREASARRYAVFSRDYSQGLAMDLGPVTNFLDCSRFLGTAAWLSAQDGQTKAAAEDLNAISRLADFVLTGPVLIDWLVGLAIDLQSVTMTAAALSAMPEDSFKAQEWSTLAAQWEQHGAKATRGLQRVIDGERILAGGWIFDRVLRNQESLAEVITSINLDSDENRDNRGMRLTFWCYQHPFRPLLIDDHAAYLRFMLALRQAASDPLRPETSSELNADIPRTAIFTRLAAPGLEGILERTAEYRVLLQLGQTGLALEDFRAQNGSYPLTLEKSGLSREMIEDSFSEQPFVYRPTERGVLLYSLGRNRIDDQADPRKDLVWRVERSSPSERRPKPAQGL
jgi:hypothetical protein